MKQTFTNQFLLNNNLKQFVQTIGIFFTLLLLIAGSVHAQTFEWVKGGGTGSRDEGLAVAIDGAGNVYMTGMFQNTVDFNPGGSGGNLTSAGGIDAFLVKYDRAGNYIWGTNIGGKSGDMGLALEVDSLGNVYITGTFNDTVNFNPDGNDAILIEHEKAQYENNDVFIAKYDSSGKFIWVKGIQGNSTIGSNSIILDGMGNIWLTGFFKGKADFNPGTALNDTFYLSSNSATSNNGQDAFVLKLDHNGQFLWAGQIKGSRSIYGYGIAADALNNIYITGLFSGTPDFDPGVDTFNMFSGGNSVQSMFVTKWDNKGDFIWAKSVGAGSSAGQTRGLDIVIDKLRELLYVTGYYSGTVDFDPHLDSVVARTGNASLRNMYLLQLDLNGNYKWANAIEANTNPSEGKALHLDNLGNPYVTGVFWERINFDTVTANELVSEKGLQEFFIVQFDVFGKHVWSENFPSARSNYLNTGGTDIKIHKGDLYITGAFRDTVTIPGFPDIVSNGGDDILLLKMSLPCATENSFSEVACDSFRFNGKLYTQSGSHSDTFINAAGCDSVVTLYLTINNSVLNPVITGHYCDSITFNDTTYTTSGIYTQVYQTTTGCDSSITYDITIGKTYRDSITETSCGSYLFNDSLITESGIYIFTYKNSTECDSTLILDVTINDIPQASVIVDGATVYAGGDAAQYQWINCADNSIIPGATGKDFSPEASGRYAVVLTENGCSDTSECVEVDVSGITELGSGNTVQLYPNPANETITIRATKALHNAVIRVVNVTGQVVLEQERQYGTAFRVDISNLAAGVYFVEVNDLGTGKSAKMKLIKQ